MQKTRNEQNTAGPSDLLLPDGRNCCTNQILYNLGCRGIEYDLISQQWISY